jgi:hypothetical protein
MRHALITTHLLHQARHAVIAQADANERLAHQARSLSRTQPVEPGGSPGRRPGPPRPRPGGTDHLTATRNRGMHARLLSSRQPAAVKGGSLMTATLTPSILTVDGTCTLLPGRPVACG